MKLATTITALGVLATVAFGAMTPAAMADSRQKNKNNWRNLAGAGAAVAGYGLLKHNKTATVVGAAGGAYAASRYEKDRHSQSQQSAARKRYHRTHHSKAYYRTHHHAR
ncbi:MAG: hypothetical protein M3Y28_10690 [Armatimonadota bacterium]|nr:hypothetical protein [Armatimonadota bacterium]